MCAGFMTVGTKRHYFNQGLNIGSGSLQMVHTGIKPGKTFGNREVKYGLTATKRRATILA